ncbi:MAG: glycosyltransferase family 4 protein [archaeon]|nr:glycosyltransferase family 4 protein [archaeon]
MYQTSKNKGQELVAQRMVRGFIKLGNEAYLITSLYHDGVEIIPPESLNEDKGYAYSEDSELGIPVIRVNSYVTRWPPRRIVFKDFIYTLERIINEFRLNVLITHSTLWGGPEEVAKFVEWRRSIKNLGGYQDPIVFCHMSHFQEPSPKRYSLSERTFRMAWNKLSLPQILREVNLLLVVTPYEEEVKVKMGAKREKCFLFPGGVDDEAFLRFSSLDTQEFFKRLNVKDNVKIISYLGSIEERKNPLAVLKVAEKLQKRHDIHFVIAGYGNSSYANRVNEVAKKLSNVTYLGEINEKEKIQLIKLSYLNIIMSKLEALGLTQLEFMFHGVPVVTSAVGGQSWLIRNEQEGIHVNGPDDINGAVGAIVRIVDDPQLWIRLSTNAKNRVKSFTISRLIHELDRAITEELVKESGLSQIPPYVHSTFLEPEQVLRSWSSGTRKVVATNRRLFIKHGVISKKVLEVPYGNITSIEHMRRYSWKTLLLGSIASIFFIIEPYLSPIFSKALIAKIEGFLRLLFPNISLQFNIPDVLLDNLPLIPISIALVIFIIQSRTGFTLNCAGMKPIYLPHAFQEAISYIRSIQDQQFKTVQGGVRLRMREHTSEQ